MNAYRDDDDDEEDDDWNDDSDAGDDSEEEPTIPCPSCGREILEDSPWCPHCERYLSEEDRAGPTRPPWVIATAIICLAMALWWIVGAFAP